MWNWFVGHSQSIFHIVVVGYLYYLHYKINRLEDRVGLKSLQERLIRVMGSSVRQKEDWETRTRSMRFDPDYHKPTAEETD